MQIYFTKALPGYSNVNTFPCRLENDNEIDMILPGHGDALTQFFI